MIRRRVFDIAATVRSQVHAKILSFTVERQAGAAIQRCDVCGESSTSQALVMTAIGEAIVSLCAGCSRMRPGHLRSHVVDAIREGRVPVADDGVYGTPKEFY